MIIVGPAIAIPHMQNPKLIDTHGLPHYYIDVNEKIDIHQIKLQMSVALIDVYIVDIELFKSAYNFIQRLDITMHLVTNETPKQITL